MKLDSSLNNRLSTKNLYFLRALDEDDDATGDWDRLFCMAINGIDIATAPCFEERTDLDRSLTPAYLACQNAVNMEMLSYWEKEYVVILSRDVLEKTKDKVHLSDLSWVPKPGAPLGRPIGDVSRGDGALNDKEGYVRDIGRQRAGTLTHPGIDNFSETVQSARIHYRTELLNGDELIMGGGKKLTSKMLL